MPPIFKEENFDFSGGKSPEHVEGKPILDEIDTSLLVLGEVQDDGRIKLLAADIGSVIIGEYLRTARYMLLTTRDGTLANRIDLVLGRPNVGILEKLDEEDTSVVATAQV